MSCCMVACVRSNLDNKLSRIKLPDIAYASLVRDCPSLGTNAMHKNVICGIFNKCHSAVLNRRFKMTTSVYLLKC